MKNFIQKLIARKWLIIGVIVLVGGGAYYYFSQKNNDTAQNTVPTTATVKRGNIEVSVSGTGQVNATSQVDLKPQVAGDGLDIVEVAVKNDQAVKKGDLIAVLDTTDIQKTIRDAKLSVETAQIKVKQTERQFDTKTVDDKYERQLQKNTLIQAQNSLSNAYDDLKDYSIRAPFDGIVTGLDFSAGDSISRDEVLASVITEDVQVTISLNEVDAAKVKVGDTVSLSFDALDGVTAQGTVSKVDTIGVVDAGVVTYDVEITFASPSELLKPGMSASADIEIEKTENVLIVPAEAVKSDGSGSYVLVQNAAEMMQHKTVETGATDDTMVEIVSGLSDGEEIVVSSVTTTNATTAEKETSSSSSSILPVGPGAGGGQRN
ncbi:MAG: efflux RND transporter periplasmic adaptor subunit [Parcubacteria group bacterium]|jgi:RND family efflux transporter MFP subunit